MNWQISWKLGEGSWVVGYGFNTIHSLSLSHQPVSDMFVSRAGAGIDSSLLFLFATTGIVGLAAYGWIGTRVGKLARQTLKKKQGDAQRMGIALISGLSAIAIHSFFNNSLFYAWILIWIWVMVAVVERYAKGLE
jgi:hypothetical protein